MGFQCGIVGLPNVGKSTLFNALTRSAIQAENYPFCTIEPNLGVVQVPDARLEALARIVKPKKVIPAAMEFVDIAGLVEGASKGEGLGNQFLHNIRETDAIAHVVRCFEDPDITHVANRISPADDIATINTELALADLETVEKSLLKALKQTRAGDKAALAQKDLLERVRDHLDAGNPARTLEIGKEQRPILRDLHLLTAKPVMYVANIAENQAQDNGFVDQVRGIAEREGAAIVLVSAAIEAEIAQLDEEEKQDFLRDLGLEEPGLNRIIRAGYRLLGLQTYFTAGEKEVRAWTIPIGASAPAAAGVIHSDFERGFIRAEVIAYDDFIACNGEQGAREAGKLRSEGKEYIVQDGDVIHFRFNV